MDYLELMAARLAGKEKSVPHWLGHKREVREFAKYTGVRTPEIYSRGGIDQISPPEASKFVLKPEFGSTSIGVKLLQAGADGRYLDLVAGKSCTWDEIKHECTIVAEKILGQESLTAANFVVEELLEGVDGSIPPADIRCYAFQGELGLILMEHHIAGPAEAMYFDGNFHPIKDVASKYSIAKGATALERIVPAVAPKNASQILNVAKRISTALPTAFCRIDLYDTPKGVTLGELTFTPGTFFYKNRKIMSASEAERLGRLWEAAFDRL